MSRIEFEEASQSFEYRQKQPEKKHRIMLLLIICAICFITALIIFLSQPNSKPIPYRDLPASTRAKLPNEARTKLYEQNPNAIPR